MKNMDLKRIFIHNLRKCRKSKGFSQMKLAELCGTAASYIGEIEIGRRFPSLKLIEKIGQVLDVEPHCFFIRDITANEDNLDETVSFLAKLPSETRMNIIHRISTVS